MLAFDLKGGLPAARRFCDRVQLFLLAASLGGVESLVVLPVYSFALPDEQTGTGSGGSHSRHSASFGRP
jgi:cystathionine beta-lyase/cystathionine gamma-synthase